MTMNVDGMVDAKRLGVGADEPLDEDPKHERAYADSHHGEADHHASLVWKPLHQRGDGRHVSKSGAQSDHAAVGQDERSGVPPSIADISQPRPMTAPPTLATSRGRSDPATATQDRPGFQRENR